MKSRILAKKRQLRSQIRSEDQVEFQEMMETLGTFGAIPVLFGIWAAACFIGGLVASGGPLAMARQFFTALTGV